MKLILYGRIEWRRNINETYQSLVYPFLQRGFFMDIKETLISADAIIQEIRAGMSENEASDLQSKLACANLNILIAIARLKPELKAYFNGCKKEESDEDG